MIINGEYHKVVEMVKLQSRQNSTWKHWSHNDQRKDHASEIVQPYTRDGRPSEAFIENYPEESVDYGFVKSEAEIIGIDSGTEPIDMGAKEIVADEQMLMAEIPEEYLWDE